MSTDRFLDSSPGSSFNVWAFSPDSSRDDELRRYGDYLSKLLGGELRLGFPDSNGNGNRSSRAGDLSRQLLLYGESDRGLWRQLVSGRSSRQILKRYQSSLLIVNQPRIPINHILLVLRIEEIDKVAVDWLIRLAQPAESDVAILPVMPMIPVVHNLIPERQQDLASLLSPNTREGTLLRAVSGRLLEAHIEANLHLRQGDPMWQLKTELVAADYDLIVVGEDPVDMWGRWFRSDLAALLPRCTRKPILVARCPRKLKNTSESGQAK